MQPNYAGQSHGSKRTMGKELDRLASGLPYYTERLSDERPKIPLWLCGSVALWLCGKKESHPETKFLNGLFYNNDRNRTLTTS